MSTLSRFFTFFQNVIVGSEEKSDDEDNMQKALSIIESSNTMESVSLVVSEKVLDYENNVIQTINTNQKVEVDCGSYRLNSWHLEERDKKYTWNGKEIPYSGCVQFGCCYDIDQKAAIKLFSNNQISSVQHDELYSSITQKIVNDVEVVVGSDDKSLRVLNKVINENKDYSLSVIERNFRNMNEIDTSNDQKIIIKSLRPLRCKNKCHEKPTAGRINQYINLDIAIENIINDITEKISKSFKEMTNTSSVTTKTVNIKELYLFSGFTVLIIVTIYILCYVIFHILYIALAKRPPPSEYITHIGATILLIIVYMFLSLIICIIRAGGIFSFKGVLCMFKHT